MNHRNAYQDYRAPAFYMITMTTHARRPLFARCADNRSLLNDDGWLVYNLWHAMPHTHGQYFDLCLEGRLLILACRPPADGRAPLTRQQCLDMNHWAATIAQAEAEAPI